jgi:signal transduction histidine kinase
VEAGDRRAAFYASLRPGKYRFQVMAANNDGLWNERGASLELTLRPHFYQTWWFAALCLAGAGALAWTLHVLRTRRLFRLNQDLERRVEERTQSLGQANREMRQMVEELKVARAEAEEATRARTQFVANVSHEIRTPMNGIIGLIGMTLDTPLSEQQQEYLRLTEQSAETLMHVLNEVLDFSKIDAGHLEIRPEPFELRRVVEDAIAILAPRAAAGVEVVCEFAPDLPQVVIADPLRMRQVILNLAGNAVKFTGKGSVKVSVRVEREEGAELTLGVSVRDTGIGIPPEKLEVIFEPFRQADSSSTRQYGGTGAAGRGDERPHPGGERARARELLPLYAGGAARGPGRASGRTPRWSAGPAQRRHGAAGRGQSGQPEDRSRAALAAGMPGGRRGQRGHTGAREVHRLPRPHRGADRPRHVRRCRALPRRRDGRLSIQTHRSPATGRDCRAPGPGQGKPLAAAGRRGGAVSYPIPRSSIRSRGVPQSRQITAWQSPQTSGFATARAQEGQ